MWGLTIPLGGIPLIEQRDAIAAIARREIAEYSNVPVYRAFHEFLGRGG